MLVSITELVQFIALSTFSKIFKLTSDLKFIIDKGKNLLETFYILINNNYKFFIKNKRIELIC